ncbi:MAG TPA: RNA-binding protein [Burkholderiales bacterium]|nr:RNA-binding protein [Burkholderiales bacterium]
MKLWLGNVAPGTTDDEIREFVKKYSPGVEIKKVDRIEGDGTRPAVSVEFVDPPFGAVQKIAMRLHRMQWKGRELFAQTMRF